MSHLSVAIVVLSMKVGDRQTDGQTDRAFIKCSTFYVINEMWKLKFKKLQNSITIVFSRFNIILSLYKFLLRGTQVELYYVLKLAAVGNCLVV